MKRLELISFKNVGLIKIIRLFEGVCYAVQGPEQSQTSSYVFSVPAQPTPKPPSALPSISISEEERKQQQQAYNQYVNEEAYKKALTPQQAAEIQKEKLKDKLLALEVLLKPAFGESDWKTEKKMTN